MAFNDVEKIKKTEKKFNCPYCRDLGMIFVESEELILNGRPIVNEASRPCICTLNGMVSKKHKHLESIPYVKGEDCISVGKALDFKNYKFFGDEDKFLHVVKSFIILHGHYNKTFKIVTGTDIAEKYVMQQPDGFVPTINSLTDTDMVVLLCVSTVNNKGTAPACYELVNNRKRAKKATWVYSLTESSLFSSRENKHPDFTDHQLVDLLADFLVIDLDRQFSKLKFDVEFRKSSQSRKTVDLNQSLAGI